MISRLKFLSPLKIVNDYKQQLKDELESINNNTADIPNSIFINNIIIGPLTQFIDFEYILWKFKLNEIYKNKETCLLTLHELNKMSENLEFNISSRYAVYLKTMFMCAFYQSVLPICIFWSILALVLNYWVDKWNFLLNKTI